MAAEVLDLHKLPLSVDKITTVDKEAPPSPEPQKDPKSAGFKQQSTTVPDLLDSEKKALQELRKIVEQALKNHEFGNAKPAKKAEEQKPSDEEKIEIAESAPNIRENSVDDDDDGAKTVEAIEETIVATAVSNCDPKLGDDEEEELSVSIWGIPLLADERSDVILMKFLRARDLKVMDAFKMLKKTIQWRKEFGIEELLAESEEESELGIDLGKTVYMQGFDKEGHPVCYNVYGEIEDQNYYEDEEKRNRYLRWRIMLLEKSIRKLDFSGGGISTIVQVNDLKNSPGFFSYMKELRLATKQALQLLQDNYPEFLHKQVFINVPWWYLAVNRMISPFLTQRTRSKFVFAGPSKSAETLLRYIGGDQIPVKYGGMNKDIGEFATTDPVTQITIKPAAKHTVEFPVSEKCEVSWEVRVVGWEVRYGAEFEPNAEESYTLIIQKPITKIKDEDEDQQQAVLCSSFKIGEPGKIVLTFHNPTSNNKILLYRFKTINIIEQITR